MILTLTTSESSPFTDLFCSFNVPICSSRSRRSDSSSSKRDFRLLNSETALKSQLPEKKNSILETIHRTKAMAILPKDNTISLETQTKLLGKEKSFSGRLLTFSSNS